VLQYKDCFLFSCICLGLSIKDVRSQGWRGLVQCGHFADKGGGSSSDAEVRTF